ncbi:WD40 repeat-like protein, partial [Backusella circina FSU 941]
MLSLRFDDDDVIYEKEHQDYIIHEDTSIDYITEEMCFHGIDMQGIEWSKEYITREEYREQRNKGFKAYKSCKEQQEQQESDRKKQQSIHPIADNEEFYSFSCSKLREPCSIGHFQLRDLVSVTNKNNIYYMHQNSIKQWSPLRQSSQTVVDLSFIKVTSMSCAHGMLLAGGFEGEVVYKRIDEPSLHYHTPQHDLGIINHADIIESNGGGLSALISSNNNQINTINFETSNTEKIIKLPFAVNCTALDRDILCVVGDSTETRLIDLRSCQNIASINEHTDYSFSCAWHPSGMAFATGNQDGTTRVYDVRNTSNAMYVLGSRMGSISSLKYSNDGAFLIAAESVDFVHVYETDDYASSQVMDMFGDIAGIGLSPDDQALYIVNTDEHMGGIFEFQRIQQDPV